MGREVNSPHNKGVVMLRKWFVYWHGEGEKHQLDLYRCLACHKLVTWTHIRSGKTCCPGRITPTNPTFLEAVRLLVLPWTF